MSEATLSRSTPQPLLELKDVWRSYNQGGSKLDVLTGASLTVRAGEMKALVGPSGSGKSTLLNIAGLLEQPDSGTVFINAIDSGQLRQGKCTLLRRQHIGFVFQFHQLLPELTATENVMLPRFISGVSKAQATEKAKAILSDLGLGHRLNHHPNQLSGGEQQRVAVARALINDPSIVLADEPSGNLDSENAQFLHELFLKLRDECNQTFVIVTHNNDLAEMVDRKLSMRDGQFQ